MDRDLEGLKTENCELRLDNLRWRKKASVFRLKLSSADEDLALLAGNLQVSKLQMQMLAEENKGLKASLQQLAASSGQAQVVQTEQVSQQQVRAWCADLRVWARKCLLLLLLLEIGGEGARDRGQLLQVQ